jgi:hypothetical protein
MEKNIKIFIGTPAYNSMVHTDFLHSIIEFYESGISFALMTLGNESLITRGRNTVLSYFYNTSDFTHLLFIDADVRVKADDVKKMISFNKDVIGAPVPLKGFDSEGNRVYNVGKRLGVEGKLTKTDRIGTAVFMLSRKAVESLVNDAKSKNDVYYSNPYTRGDSQNLLMYDVFKTGVRDKVYDSEDFYVCNTLMELGYDIFVYPDAAVTHNGMFSFN